LKIGICYVATGRYICFWEDFFHSAEKHLFKNHEKTYFLITDAENPPLLGQKQVKKYFYPKLPWPYSALNKYEAVLTAKEQLGEMDYIYYFNGNMLFIDEVGDEIIPTEQDFAICEWAHCFGKKDSSNFPYDKNPECWAHIDSGAHYFMGGLHGGKAAPYIKMCEELDAHTKADVEKGVIALCHDESYINKYMLDKSPLLIAPNYAMPQNWKVKGLKAKNKAVILKKHHWKYGGHAYLRGDTDVKITRGQYYLGKVLKLFGLKI
jgi:hypothetical protein